MSLHIKAVADVASPWSYVGLRSVKKALSNLQEKGMKFDQVKMKWEPFCMMSSTKAIANSDDSKKILSKHILPTSTDFERQLFGEQCKQIDLEDFHLNWDADTVNSR